MVRPLSRPGVCAVAREDLGWGQVLKVALDVSLHVHRLIRLRNSPRYQHAVANPGLITFTGPYLDVGGAGYVVTISHTIHASR